MAGMCKVHSFASSVVATGCELNMSNLQQGYNWMKSCVSENKRQEKGSSSFSSQPWLATSTTWC